MRGNGAGPSGLIIEHVVLGLVHVCMVCCRCHRNMLMLLGVIWVPIEYLLWSSEILDVFRLVTRRCSGMMRRRVVWS